MKVEREKSKPLLNMIKLVFPDFVIGKMLLFARAILGITTALFRNPSMMSCRLAWLILRITPAYTMLSPMRLINLYDLVQKANSLNLPGDIAECGTWNGGSAVIMAVACQDDKAHFVARNFWLFDSFHGLPRPGERDGTREKNYYFKRWCNGDPKKVKKIFSKLGIPLENVKIIPGWFDSTLKTVFLSQIAFLHIDADWYDSVKIVLESLYNKVVEGGYIVLDDYGAWEGTRRAVEDYLREHEIEGISLKTVDRCGAYFQKPKRSVAS